MPIKKTIVDTITHYEEKDPWKTAEEMEEFCCYPRAGIDCQEKVTPWTGYEPKDVAPEIGPDGKDADGNKVVIHFASRKNPCGVQVIEQSTTPNNCCDVTPVIVELEERYVLARGTQALIRMSGGKPPYNWVVSGQGFYLDSGYTLKEGTTQGPSVYVYSDETSCGFGFIYVTDGCSSVESSLYSTEGKWTRIYIGGIYSGGTYDPPSMVEQEPRPGVYAYYGGSGHVFQAYEGRYRLSQGFYIMNYYQNTVTSGVDDCDYNENKWIATYGDYQSYGIAGYNVYTANQTRLYVDPGPAMGNSYPIPPDMILIPDKGWMFARCEQSGYAWRAGFVGFRDGAFAYPDSEGYWALVVEEWSCV